MEITLSAESVAIIGICVVILLAVVGGFIAQVRYTSRLPTREELHATCDELRQEMATMREELRQEMVAMREEFRRDMAAMRDELREEFRRDMATMREEFSRDMAAMRDELRQEMAAMRNELLGAIRESEARIIKALVNHQHPQPDGPTIFIEPV